MPTRQYPWQTAVCRLGWTSHATRPLRHPPSLSPPCPSAGLETRDSHAHRTVLTSTPADTRIDIGRYRCECRPMRISHDRCGSIRAGRQSCRDMLIGDRAMLLDWGIKRRKDKDNEEKSKKDEEIFGDMEKLWYIAPLLTWESIQNDHQPTNKFNTNDETT